MVNESGNSARIVLVPLSARSEHLSTEELSRRAQAHEKRFRLLIPVPRRSDIGLKFGIVARGDQFMAEFRIEALPQALLVLDDLSAQPVTTVIAQEIASLAERIEADLLAIYACVDDGSAGPLSPRQANLLQAFGGTAVHLELPTGPFDQRFPDEPAPIDETPRTYSAQVNAHYRDSVIISRVFEETEMGVVLVPTHGGQQTLILSYGEKKATDALHRKIADIFIEGGDRRVRFIGSALVSLSDGKVRQIIFERLLEQDA